MSFQEPKHLLSVNHLLGRPWAGRGQGPFISDRPGYLFAANSREEVVSQAAGVELQLGRGPGRGQDGLERASRTRVQAAGSPLPQFPQVENGDSNSPHVAGRAGDSGCKMSLEHCLVFMPVSSRSGWCADS